MNLVMGVLGMSELFVILSHLFSDRNFRKLILLFYNLTEHFYTFQLFIKLFGQLFRCHHFASPGV